MKYVDRGNLQSIHQAARRARSEHVHHLLSRLVEYTHGRFVRFIVWLNLRASRVALFRIIRG